MKNLIKSRRGIAIEMAIGAMFIMMALSIVLISISGMQTRHMKNDRNDFHEKIEVYEITDYIMEHRDATSYNGYDISSATGDTTVTYTVTKDGETILTFTVDNNNTITSWRD